MTRLVQKLTMHFPSRLKMEAKRFLLLYGSVTGKAQSIAEIMAEEASTRGLDADMQCMEDVDKKV